MELRLPDPGASRAVLLGVSGYRHLEPLPAVAGNLQAMRRLLTDPGVWGLPSEHCRAVLDPESGRDVINPVEEACLAARDTLLIYYAGHGLNDRQTGELLLALAGTSAPYEALRYSFVREPIVTSPASRRIVILDCCYGGRAVGAMSAPVTVERVLVRGSYVLVAAPRDAIAHAPPGKPYTAFTAELVRLLDKGIAGGPEYLSLDLVTGWLSSELVSQGFPKPESSDRNGIGDLPWLRNRAYRQPAAKQQVSSVPIPDPVPDHAAGTATRTTPARTAPLPAPGATGAARSDPNQPASRRRGGPATGAAHEPTTPRVQAPLGSSPRETRPARKAPPRLARALREAAMKRARRRRNLLAFGTVGLASVIVAVAVVIGALVDRAGDAAGTVTTTRPPNNALAAIACGGKTPKPVQRRTFSKAPATVIKDSATYDAIVKTSCGTFTIRLDANKAPKTVNSIVYLARARFYDSTRFHRIVPGGAANIGIIQGGDPAGDGSGGPGYQLPDEFPPAASAYVKYTVAMASSGPGTTGSQFFVNFQDNSRMLQPSYTLVGRVIDGKDVVDKIAKISVAGPHGDIPSQAVWIERMTVRETLAR